MQPNDTQVCEDLMKLVKHVKTNLIALAEAHDLTLMQVNALYAIHNGNVNMGKVAESLHCDASNITGIVDRLVGQKLITRHESEQDRRAKALHLTPQGQAVVDELFAQLPEKLGCPRLNQIERESLHIATSKLV